MKTTQINKTEHKTRNSIVRIGLGEKHAYGFENVSFLGLKCIFFFEAMTLNTDGNNGLGCHIG